MTSRGKLAAATSCAAVDGGSRRGVGLRRRLPSLLLCALLPGSLLFAQSPSVEDLFAADWQARNRAAAALVAAEKVDEAALVAAMGRKADPGDVRGNDFGWSAAVGLGRVHDRADPVRDLEDRHRFRMPFRPMRAEDRTPLASADLVLPFDSRTLAAFVLAARGVRSTAFVDALSGLAADEQALGPALVAARTLHRLGPSAAEARKRGLGVPAIARRLAACANLGDETAATELAAALRSGSDEAKEAILDSLDASGLAARPELVRAVLALVGAEATELARIAAAVALEAELHALPEFAPLVADRATAELATLVVFEGSKLPHAVVQELRQLVLDAKAPPDARVRAAFVLGRCGPDLERDAPDLARSAFDALAAIYADRQTAGELGLAAIAAMGGYAVAMTPECERRLVTHASAWLSRIRGGAFAALGALLAAGRVDAMPLEQLESHWREHARDGLADGLAIALMRRGPDVDSVLLERPGILSTLRVGDGELRRVAPILRAWLSHDDPRLVDLAVEQLARLGVDAGVEEETVFRMLRDGLAGRADPEAAGAARNWLAAIARTEAAFDWLAANWGATLATEAATRGVARSAFPLPKRTGWIRVLLARGGWSPWPIEEMDREALRSVAREMLAGEPERSLAWDALAELGPLEPEDERRFLSALRGDAREDALRALRGLEVLPASITEALRTLAQDADIGRQACDLLWFRRVR